MTKRYVKSTTAPLYDDRDRVRAHLLWGDEVRVTDDATWADYVGVRARGMRGWVPARDLGREPLLELYFIDVGQGDGVLVRTPDGRHVLIDGGSRRSQQPTGKNAADFVDWKFVADYGRDRIELDAMIATHCDADHYGGLWDLLGVDREEELDAEGVDVGAFYHAGVSWWERYGDRSLGPTSGGYLTWLLEDEASVREALRPDARRRLQGWWKQFLRKAAARAGRIERLAHTHRYLPGFGPGDGEAVFRVLAPIERSYRDAPALTDYPGGDGANANGHSVTLRLDYGGARILLTGDLNRPAHAELLGHYADDLSVFECDVAKACHHGSEDVSYAFLSAMRPAVSVISSGDSEGYSHPRASIVAASAATGHTEIAGDRLRTPLVYMTELSRSYQLGRITRISSEEGDVSAREDPEARLHLSTVLAGEFHGRRETVPLAGARAVSRTIYGLVNVRTDGETILCAVRNEKDGSWDVETIPARFRRETT